MAAQKKKRRRNSVLTPTLKERHRAGDLLVTPALASSNPRERGRVGLTPLRPPVPGGRFDSQTDKPVLIKRKPIPRKKRRTKRAR